MKTIDNIINPPVFEYLFPHPKEDILFIDIETTGLSPKASSLYLIGAMYFDTVSDSWHLKQFFADDYKSEAAIISSFMETLCNYKYLYHFNGKTFDIPYILSKCKKHNIKPDKHCTEILNDAESKYSIDILAMIRPLKKLLSIEKANQTELEHWLNIEREDKYTGGELISVYTEYMQSKITSSGKAAELERLLLLHNHDDIEQMLNICSIISYRNVFSDENIITITDITEGTGNYININFKHGISVPKKVNITKSYPVSRAESLTIPEIKLILDKNTGTLCIPILQGILKHFYSNYKDYYYLENEDTAVHKSLISLTDKNNRKKATASTCYIKKEGLFIPSVTLCRLNEENMQFFITYRDKICFYMIPDEIIDIENPFWCSFTSLQLSSFNFIS